jgi:histidinol-phosphate phosphatase family protein
MARLKTIICIDRDGTLIYDDKYHLGRTNGWKKLIKILPSVVTNLKQLRKIPNVAIYMITNQPGVAVKDWPLLTEDRAHKVCQHILRLFEEKGFTFDGYFLCGHANPAYMKRRPNRTYIKSRVCNCGCVKPRLGMIFKTLKAEGVQRKDVRLFVIGDRYSDVKTALNAKGTGIHIPFKNEKEQQRKMETLKKNKNVYFARDFKDAVKFIVKKRYRND